MFSPMNRFLTIIFSLVVCFYGNANLLTYQQINLLLENDDIQIFTPSSPVKKVTLTVEESTDTQQGKTIVEYKKSGLLINYYQISVIEDAEQESDQKQNTMITTLMRTEEGKWQRKQTLGSYEIDNSVYELIDDHLQMTMLPAGNFTEQRTIVQHNRVLDNRQGQLIHFAYAIQPEKEKLSIDYQFNQDTYLTAFNFYNIDEHEYGYTSSVKVTFEYDKLKRLIKSTEINYYQFMDEPVENIITQSIYSNFDQCGNWKTKVEQSGDDQIIYKREIEYW